MASVVFDISFSFSETGKYFCYCGNDGKLKIWDTSTGVLQQEYTKNLHLSSPCTSLVWLQTNKSSPNKRRKLNSNSLTVTDSQDVIAFGTTSGTVMLYSVSSNNVIANVDCHTSRINSLSHNRSRLFTCSDDKHIVEVDIDRHKVKSKWKAGKERVKCILALSSGDKLVSASCTIKLWDLETYTVLKTFVGHSSEVFTLLEVPDKESYFISAAKGDRVISAWSIEDNDSCVASFVLPDSAASMNFGKRDGSKLCAVSESGILHVFQHKLSGSTGKPLKPKINVTIAAEDAGSKGQGAPLPIYSGLPMDSDSVLLVYGNPAFLVFEIILLSDYRDENITLLRQARKLTAPDEFNNRNKVPNLDGNVQYLKAGDINAKPRGKQRDVPLEQRIDNLALASPSVSETLKKDNMAQLLLQGLQSKNKNMIHDVLFRREESVVTATVRNLPVQSLHPLLKELTTLLQGKTFTCRVAVTWLNAVLRSHAAILLSNPSLAALVEPLLTTIDSKVGALSALLRLKGRLTIVAEQLGCIDNSADNDVDEPLLTYQDRDEDSDSEQASSENSSDEWDEFSEMDNSGPD